MQRTNSVMKAKHLLLLIALASVGIAGCKSNSTSPTQSAVGPGVGSWYKYSSTTRDSTGKITSQDSSTQTIIRSGISLGGFNDVMLDEEVLSDGSRDSSYLRYLSNGYLAIYYHVIGANQIWLELPFATHEPHSISFDTTIVDVITTTISGTVTATNLRSENVTVKGSALSSNVDQLTVALNFGGKNTGAIVSEMSYAPAIGFLDHTRDISSHFAGKQGDLSESTLVDYQVK
jgi:hypothetical protein